MSKRKLKKIRIIIFTIILLLLVCIEYKENSKIENIIESNKICYEISNIPDYNGEIYVQINNNIPNFTIEDMNIEEDYYSNLQDGKVRNSND